MSDTHEEQVSSYIPSSMPSAPVEETNGFEHVEQTDIENAVDKVVETVTEQVTQEAAPKLDSTPVEKTVEAPAPTSAPSKTAEPTEKKICSACPATYLRGSCLAKMLQVEDLPPNVQNLVLWKCPKYTGAVFGTSFVLLLSIACCSLLTVVSSLFLLTMVVVGAYRFYLSVVYRIKGTYDETFDKALAYDLSLPKEKIQELARLLDTDMNQSLNKLKSVLLWDNVTTSLLYFTAFYFVYCIGSVFNTTTLLLIALVKVFTIPKVYQVYKVQIDQGLDQAATCAHNLARQVEAKIPPSVMQFVHKFKKE